MNTTNRPKIVMERSRFEWSGNMQVNPQGKRRSSHDGGRTGEVLRCNMEETQS